MSPGPPTLRAVVVALVLASAACAPPRGPGPAETRLQVPAGRTAVEALEMPPIEFDAPEVEQRDVGGVPVLLLSARELPLVTVYAYFEGGYGRFDRERYAAAMGLAAILRTGGTVALPPDSVDVLLEHYALQTTFGTAGGSITASVNTLTEHLDVAISLWGQLLAQPRFDAREIEAWRGRQLEGVRRLADDPARLAFSEFNRLLFGDHPVGWEMAAEDLAPELLTPDRFRWVHERVVCRDHLVIGVTGDASWTDVERVLAPLVDLLRPCPGPLPEEPTPVILRERGVYVLERDLEQAVIVMAHPTAVHLGDTPEYYSAMIGNSILGGGGFSSRILGRVRTEEGYAYSATSLWTKPREHDGIVGAITRTRPENAAAAIEVILDTMEDLTRAPPDAIEVGTAVDRVVNGFVFNFADPGQIVARTMLYLAQDFPGDWLERYVRGVQRVTASTILETFADHLHPERMTILVVGDPDRMGRSALERWGPVTTLPRR